MSKWRLGRNAEHGGCGLSGLCRAVNHPRQRGGISAAWIPGQALSWAAASGCWQSPSCTAVPQRTAEWWAYGWGGGLALHPDSPSPPTPRLPAPQHLHCMKDPFCTGHVGSTDCSKLVYLFSALYFSSIQHARGIFSTQGGLGQGTLASKRGSEPPVGSTALRHPLVIMSLFTHANFINIIYIFKSIYK